jgi:hypothetical protein
MKLEKMKNLRKKKKKGNLIIQCMPKFKHEDLAFLPDEQIDLSCPHPFNGRKLF